MKLKTWHLAALFGLVYLIAGLLSLDQYGIPYDEETQRYNNGLYNYNYIIGEDKESLRGGNEKYHGPAFEVSLIFIEKALGLTEKRDIALTRHFVNFMVFFLSLIVMFFLGRGVFKSDKWALFTCLVYGLFPRFFAEAHYNSKDIIFVSFLVLSFYTLFRFANNTNFKWALLHALATGYLVDVRIMGLFMPVATVAFLLYYQFVAENRNWLKLSGVLAAYFVLQALSIIAFWPILWDGPIHHLTNAWLEMNRSEGVEGYFFWTGDIKYWGEIYKYDEIPRHYLLGWMLMTIPLFFQLLGWIGIVWLTIKAFKLSRKVHHEHGFLFLCLACFVGMIAMITIKKPAVYDGWRHMYFLYVPFALIATFGAQKIWKKYSPKLSPKALKPALVGFFILVFIGPTYSTISHHPYQFVYFNNLASMIFSPIEENFEMDYWGLGYRQGLEYLLANNEGDISLKVEHSPGYDNQFIFEREVWDRLKYTKSFYRRGMYYLADYRATKEIKPKIDAELVYELKSPSGSFLWVYKTLDSLHIKNNLYTEFNDFENYDSALDTFAYSGQEADWVGPGKEYGYTIRKVADSSYTQGKFAVRVSAKFATETKDEPNLSYTLSIDRGGKTIFWKGEWIGFIFNKPGEWVEWNLEFDNFGDIQVEEGDEIAVYMLGGAEVKVLQDDLKVTFLTYEEGQFEIE